MPVINLFSKRQKKLRGQVPDVYLYDNINKTLRVQIVNIIQDAIGIEAEYNNYTNDTYRFLHETLSREYGVFGLIPHERSNSKAVFNYFLNCDDYEKCIDVVELSFKIIDGYVKEHPHYFHGSIGVKLNPEDAIEELNARFKEHGVGYQFESSEIIRIDSNIIHSDVVKPVLHLLGSSSEYSGPNDEFLKAHEHYRHGRNKECLVECLKALESLLKVICSKNSWKYDKTDTAKKLIGICFDNELIPSYLQSQFTSLRSLLESGVPTVRNKEGSHGQGEQVITVPDYLSSYALHLTATNMLFLANCQMQKR